MLRSDVRLKALLISLCGSANQSTSCLIFGNFREMDIFGLGNPLLDITATVDDDFLNKYSLPKNSAILAEPQHEAMYEEVINKFEIEYSAGGATQNTMRYCQWVVGKNNQVTTFCGAVGNDYFGKIMEKKAKTDGVNVKYLVVEEQKNTGTCAILLTDGGQSRAMCAYLGMSYVSHNSLSQCFLHL
ncbi:unnamed protein product, partial [Oppiella nova]